MYRARVHIDYDAEIKRVDNAIVALNNDLEDLVYKRYELIAKKYNLNMHDLMDFIIRNNLVSKDVIELIVSSLEKKRGIRT